MTLNRSNLYILKIFENDYKWFIDNDLVGGFGALYGTTVL
jgi:hypothetical protein